MQNLKPLNKTRASRILGIQCESEITESTLKKQYRKMALIYHPDKNTEPDASSKFQEINAAYTYLLPISKKEEDIDDDYDPSQTSYSRLLFQFLKKFNRVSLSSIQNDIFYKIVEKISVACRDKVLNILEGLDKSILIKMYEIFKEHQEIFHFSEGILEEIGEILRRKVESTESIILNPFLEDLLEHNLYKLTINGIKYIIPLWHHELVYDHSGNDLHILCNPILADNMYIDVKNNLFVRIECELIELWNQIQNTGFYKIELTENDAHIITIPGDSITFQKDQTFVLNHRGIARMDRQNVYNVSCKGDIILYLTII